MQGGVGDFTQELALALTALRHEVHVITRIGCADEDQRAKDKDHAGQTHAAGLTIHSVVSHWGWRSPGQVLALARRLALDVLNVQYQAAAYDLHPAINFTPLLVSRPWGRRMGLVVTFHDLKVPYLFPKAGPLREWVVTFLARRADAAVVTNRLDELELATRGIGRLERIPIGSNIAPAFPDDYDRRAWRARLGMAPEDCLLGFFGFFNARKGLETLLRALAILQTESPGAASPGYRLLFIGGTVGSSDATNRAYADRIRAFIDDLGLGDRVHYTGFVPTVEVSAAFAAIDLCILPYADGISFHHGTLMAALAHRQAIVSTQPPVELPELTHGENVWLVPPEDPEALAAAIGMLSADLERRQRLARGAAALSAQFTWERIAARTADLFEGVKVET